MSQVDAPAADWYPDPSGRFQFRYWDGETWTGHVSTDGKTDWDPPADGAQEQAGGQEPQSTELAASQQSAQPETAQPETAQPEQPAQAEEPAQAESPPAPEAAAEGPAAPSASDDDRWAPQADAEPAGEPIPAPADQADGDSSQGEAPQGGTIEEDEPSDANLVANRRADLESDVEAWVDDVAHQVEPRLSRINAEWTSQPQAEAARACAYGLLIGHLAHLHPHMRGELSQVAEAHPSFTTLEAGSRLDTLEQIARDHQRSAAWLGPLIGTEDAERVAMLFD